MVRRPNLVADELLAFGRELYAGGNKAGVVVQFTAEVAANRFVLECPNAFLFGVIFDEGISAERAWAAPYHLRARLGHFDMARLAASDELEVSKAVAGPPALHRYVAKTPRRLINAARRLVEHYNGDAANIWAAESTATDVKLRLRAFDGIGQKKAAMAVNLLMRDLLVPLKGEAATEVAYDIHVRRVFLRSRLAPVDDVYAINLAAKQASPDNPGALDIAAWIIGRKWCRPGKPLCEECRIARVCPRDVNACVF
jgi:endonuclease-3